MSRSRALHLATEAKMGQYMSTVTATLKFTMCFLSSSQDQNDFNNRREEFILFDTYT